MADSSLNGWKTLWEKKKLPVTSNFSFFYSVFKRLVQETRKNQGLFGKGLKANTSTLVERLTSNLYCVIQTIVQTSQYFGRHLPQLKAVNIGRRNKDSQENCDRSIL